MIGSLRIASYHILLRPRQLTKSQNVRIVGLKICVLEVVHLKRYLKNSALSALTQEENVR